MAIDKKASAVLQRLCNEIPPKYNTDIGTVLYDILAAVAIELEGAYDIADNQVKKNLIATATGADLDALISQLGYTRKTATYARGYVTITGIEGTNVPVGTLVACGKNLYEITESGIINGGSATVSITAKYPGSDGNALAGSVNYFPVMPENLLTVNNIEPISGGTDAETDMALRERYYYFLEHPVTSGNVYEYEAWAMEIDGVGFAKCYGTWNGPGTVKVVIATSDMEPAGTELVNAVAKHIEEQRLIGPTITVVSAVAVTVNISAKLVMDGAFSFSAVEKSFKKFLVDYLKTLGFSGAVIPYTKVGALLQNQPGVEYYTDLRLNGGTSNIEIKDGELGVIGTVSLMGGD